MDIILYAYIYIYIYSHLESGDAGLIDPKVDHKQPRIVLGLDYPHCLHRLLTSVGYSLITISKAMGAITSGDLFLKLVLP